MPVFEPVFRALNDAAVRYVVVGGVAVVLQGHARLTADVDLVVDLEPDPAARAINALVRLGLRARPPVDALDFARPDVRRAWVEQKGLRVFSLWDPGDPLREVDLFVESPLPFDELWSRADVVDLPCGRVRVACIRDLIAMKRLADRPEDRLDIEALEAIEQERARER